MSETLPFLVGCYTQAERSLHTNAEAIKRQQTTADATAEADPALLAERDRLDADRQTIFRLLHSVVGQIGTPRELESVDEDVRTILRHRPRP